MLNLAFLLRQFASLTALLNPRSLALKRPALSSSDLNCRRTNLTIATLPAKQIKTNKDCKKSTHRQGFNSSSSLELQKTSDNNNVQLVRDNIEELIYISKVKHTYVQAHTVPYPNPKKYLSNSTENSLQRYNYYNLQDRLTPRELSSIYVLRSEQDYSAEEHNHRKFYHLVITSKDTHYKQTIKKAYIMSLERASLILFII
ncbi:hypothetical protein HBH72_010960 [Parastagonospora nodorum]|nr:hypothetical protein HBH72_010960 [Parastagonospora nodorum]